VLRYVLIYMPLSAALVGVFVMLRRRAVEKRSRSEARDDTPKASDNHEA